MSYEPWFSITPKLLSQVEIVAALRERILGAAVELSWMPGASKGYPQPQRPRLDRHRG